MSNTALYTFFKFIPEHNITEIFPSCKRLCNEDKMYSCFITSAPLGRPGLLIVTENQISLSVSLPQPLKFWRVRMLVVADCYRTATRTIMEGAEGIATDIYSPLTLEEQQVWIGELF